MAWLSLLLKGKKVAGAIKSLKPFSKTGAKSVESWKSAAAKAKLDSAKFNLKETFKKSDEVLDKLKKTVQKTKHYYKD
jgi:uncharacterized membrane-anchored protein YhcB (DUF1043 family)